MYLKSNNYFISTILCQRSSFFKFVLIPLRSTNRDMTFYFNPHIIMIIILNNFYSAKIQKFSGASQSMRNIIKNILITNIYKINENKKINKLNKFKTNKSLGSF